MDKIMRGNGATRRKKRGEIYEGGGDLGHRAADLGTTCFLVQCIRLD